MFHPLYNNGNPDYLGLINALDKYTEMQWMGSVTESNFHINEKMFKSKVQISSITQEAGEIVLALGAAHQGYGWVNI